MEKKNRRAIRCRSKTSSPGKQRPRKKPNSTHRRAPGGVTRRPNSGASTSHDASAPRNGTSNKHKKRIAKNCETGDLGDDIKLLHTKIIKSIATSIYDGLDDIKKAIALAVFGGLEKSAQGKHIDCVEIGKMKCVNMRRSDGRTFMQWRLRFLEMKASKELIAFLVPVDRNGLNASYYHVNAPHSLDPLTTLKAKVIDNGKASALNQHERRPKSLFTL
ncbi:hypothetical protein Tco_0679129 [Tanacetum coccineum]|uniref:Uncharacterized protein n=1 Tax=Tanacetum coccineum TaxID=301880 RepID=A0ABQ4XHR0_9ASTR